MMNKKYLLYLDILGFKNLAMELAEKLRANEDIIRQRFLSDPIKERLKVICGGKIQVIAGISEIEGSDNYILIIDDLQTVFKIIGDISRIPMYLNDSYIPLEIGVGTKSIDENIVVDNINRTEIIEFLKMDILNPYRKMHKAKSGQSIRDTFVVITTDVFEDLDPFDRNFCYPEMFNGTTFYNMDISRIYRRCKLFDFLDKIKYDSKLYLQIDDLYIPPIEYPEIENLLKDERIAFITGTTECGKTYTAIKLLWEYFLKGFKPIWWSGKEEKDRIEVRRKLLEIQDELKNNSIIYFEDPFGQSTYEKMENLEREIGSIIANIKNTDNAYIIITSRDEIFKKFLNEKISITDINKFEKKLNLKKPSYDSERRKEILIKWANAKNCLWLKNEHIKNKVLEYLADDKNLPTPLSIREFVISTINISDDDELIIKKLKETSGNTANRFAREIENMDLDKMILILFPFIGNFKIEFAKSQYEQLSDTMKNPNRWYFEKILKWFENDKISLSEGNISFSHPSYGEALPFLLVNDNELTPFNKIFSKVLLELSNIDESASDVAYTICTKYDMLPTDTKILLYKLLNNEKSTLGLSLGITSNFENLPNDIQNMLITLSEKKEGWIVAWPISYYFSKLPKNIQDILSELAKVDFFARPVSSALAANFRKISPTVRNRLLYRFYDNFDSTQFVATILRQNFEEIPARLRSKLLIEISKKDDFSKDIFDPIEAIIVVLNTNFESIEEQIRNKIFIQLSERIEFYPIVGALFATKFEELNDEVRNTILKNMRHKEQAREEISYLLKHKFNLIRKDLRNSLLMDYLEKEDLEIDLSMIAKYNYEEIEKDLMEKIIDKISKNEGAAENLAIIIRLNYERLDETKRNRIIIKLMKNDKTKKDMAHIVMQNYKELPKSIMDLIGDIRGQIQVIIKDYSACNEYSILAIAYIVDFWPHLDSQFVADTLNEIKLSTKSDAREAAGKILQILSDHIKS